MKIIIKILLLIIIIIINVVNNSHATKKNIILVTNDDDCQASDEYLYKQNNIIHQSQNRDPLPIFVKGTYASPYFTILNNSCVRITNIEIKTAA